MKTEEYIFDYLEGSLDAPAEKKFQQWLIDDPKRVEQLREWEQAYLPAETILYKHKELLKKPARNWTAYKWAASVSLLALGIWGFFQWTREAVQIADTTDKHIEAPLLNETKQAPANKTEVAELLIETEEAAPAVIASIPLLIDQVKIPKQSSVAEAIIKETPEIPELLDQSIELHHTELGLSDKTLSNKDQSSESHDSQIGLSNKKLDLSSKNTPIYVRISVTNRPKKSRKPVSRLLALIDNIQDYKKIKL